MTRRARRGEPRGGARALRGGARSTGPAPRGDAAAAAPQRHAWRWALAGALAILPLLWASRSPTLGMPVADDYIFLARLAVERPLDFLGPMGCAFYWRPVSRQLYYLLLGPWLMRAPWLAALLATTLLVALYALLFRIARRFLPASSAAALACFPLLAEPARVLIAWPSAAQHLIGAVFAALAIERAAGGGIVLASAAALLAMLSNEAAFVVLPALPLVAGFRTRSLRDAARWGAAALLVAVLWGAGYSIARHHGVGFPASVRTGLQPLALWAVLVQSVFAQFGGEGLDPAWRGPLLALSGLLVAAGIAASFARAARRRLAGAAPALLGGLAWFLAGITPLALLLPDWNAWRTTVPGLGLAVALAGWLALASRPLAVALVALRLVVLLLVRPAPAEVSQLPPPGASGYSFAQTVRLQRTVESTRRALLESAPRLPGHAIVRYWNLPRLAEVGFAGPRALHLWYGDTTLVWAGFGGPSGWQAPAAVIVEYERQWPWPAVAIGAEAQRLYRQAYESSQDHGLSTAESLLVAARRAQPREAPAFHGVIEQNLAWIAFYRHDYARADSLNRLALDLEGENPGYWSLVAQLAATRGDLRAARAAAALSLQYDPHDPRTLGLMRSLGAAPAPRP